MTVIKYKQSLDEFKQLNIAGEFNGWKIVPMKLENGVWLYDIDLKKVPKGLQKVHFKFIGDNDNWFVGSSYPQEIDEHFNENNVISLNELNDVKQYSNTVFIDELKQNTDKIPSPRLVTTADSPIDVIQNDVQHKEKIEEILPHLNESDSFDGSLDTNSIKQNELSEGVLKDSITKEEEEREEQEIEEDSYKRERSEDESHIEVGESEDDDEKIIDKSYSKKQIGILATIVALVASFFQLFS